MLRPASLWQQYSGKAQAEALRGNGIWPLQPHPCELEPPWESYNSRAVSVWDCILNDWEGPWEGSWLRRTFSLDTPLFRNGQQLILPELQCLDYENLVPIVVEQFCEDQTTIPKIQQFLLSLPSLHRPLSFEVMGWGPQSKWDNEKFKEILNAQRQGEKRDFREARCGWEEPYTVVQFVADKTDADQVQNQLISHYPNSAIVVGENVYNATPGSNLQNENSHAATLILDHVYCQPLRIFGKLDPDPLGVAIAAMEQLDKDDWALLQILFEPARNPWAETVTAALTNPYKPNEYLFNNVSEKMLREKFSSPLFAVSIRILASKMSVYRQLEGWAQQFASPPQGLSPNKSSWEGNSMPEFERNFMSWSVDARCTHLPGMILNLNELSSLVHLPSESIVTERLRRVKSRTRPAPKIKKSDESVILGDNMHRGKKQLAVIPLKQRLRHCYVAGATGTGKSTLLLNMIIQDIQAGRGVGVLDPHGDLINAVLERIPQERVDDVILFDPADDEFPFALNILEAKDESEQERIVNETISAMQKQFAASWGQRLQRILTYTIQTVLQVIPGATLGEVERMLVDHEFREKTVEKITDPRLAVFWREQFKFLTSAIDPVLNKLSVFLASRVVRNIICQPRSAVDFDVLINQRKILLANLSTGLLSDMVSGTLGSFIVTKIINAAFRRVSIPEEKRVPWYLYVDEFQAFMDLSIGFDRICNETRKFKLVLAGLANQYVGQLSPQVRQSVFGNVGTLITFRMGVEDVNAVARHMRGFTGEEILGLTVGEALVHIDDPDTTFNLKTYPPPPTETPSPADEIVKLARERYATPRAEVEARLGIRQKQPNENSKTNTNSRSEMNDPNEDDLVQ